MEKLNYGEKTDKKSTRGGSRTHEPEGPELEPDAFDHSATRVKFDMFWPPDFVAIFRN